MIPCTGTIKASDINVELGRSPNGLFKIGSAEERSLAGVPNGLIKFSDFACKSAADPLPWYLYEVDQTGGRSVGKDPAIYSAIDGWYAVFWGGTNGWLKFNNHFTTKITQIQVTWKYQGRNGGWHGINIYERSNPDSVYRLGNNRDIQVFTLNVNIEPGSEIWLHWSGGGDRGDGNNVDYVAITGVSY